MHDCAPLSTAKMPNLFVPRYIGLGLCSVSQRPQFLQHLLGVHETAILKVFPRSSQRSMEQGTVFRIEPVSRIEGKEIYLSSFRELRRFVQHEPAVVNAGFEDHAFLAFFPGPRWPGRRTVAFFQNASTAPGSLGS